jgi:hypothetical protein
MVLKGGVSWMVRVQAMDPDAYSNSKVVVLRQDDPLPITEDHVTVPDALRAAMREKKSKLLQDARVGHCIMCVCVLWN